MTIGALQNAFADYRTYTARPRETGAMAGTGETMQDGQVNGNGSLEKDADGKKKAGRFDKNECQTCKNRTYQDGSNDPGVSFKTPTKISPENAASAVMGHEMEHVTRNQAEAKSKGREVISQSVTIHTGVCGECGRVYVAGGETRTVTGERKQKSDADKFNVGLEASEEQSGKNLDAVA